MIEGNKPLPTGWIWSTIGEVTTPITTIRPDEEPQTKFIYLDISSIDNDVNRITEPKEYYGYEAPSRARQQVMAGDVLFSTVRTYLKNIAMVPEAYDGQVASTGFAILRGKEDISTKYLFYYSLTEPFLERLGELQRGTSYPAVRDGDVRSQPIPLAPFQEQKRIVDEIETQFTRLDDAVADLRRLQHNLDRYRASVLKAAFEGRLVPQDPAAEPAEQLLQRILDERRSRWEEQEWQKHVERAQKKVAQARRKAAGRPARLGDLEPEEWQDVPEEEYLRYLPKGEKWKETYDNQGSIDLTGLPELPPNWTWARVDQLGDVRLGRQRSPQHHSGPNMRPYLRAANATWNGVDLTDVKEMNFEPEVFESYRLVDGDILLAEASGSASEVGKPFIWREEIEDCAFQNTLIRVRLDSPAPEYFKWHFYKDALTGRFGQIAKGVGIYHLGATRLAEMPIALPPFREQQRIVDELERRLSVIDELSRQVGIAQVRAERLRQSILEKAFTGRLVTQDPDDEPAEKLLERIRNKVHSEAEQLSLL
jgi:type I restriction enzyme, S subunit